MSLKFDTETRLDNAHKQLLGSKAPVVLDYSGSWETLWSFEALAAEELFKTAQTNGLVLVWGENSDLPPLGAVRLCEHVNPLTWCVCAVNRFDGLKVAVLDTDHGNHSGYRFYKVVQSLDAGKLPFALLKPPFLLDKDKFPCFETLAKPKVAQAALDLLRSQITVALTEHGEERNHHALASIVGPLVLMGRAGLELKSAKPNQKALCSLFKEVDLLKATRADAEGQLDIGALKFVLLDDQAENGWSDWLTACVGAANPSQVVPISDSKKFQEYVRLCRKAEGETAIDKRFRSVAPGVDKDDLWVLLLDIHLFQSGGREEKDFYKELVGCVKGWGFADGDKRFAWDSIPKKELEVVEAWADGKGERPEDEVLLSLFPRFLALLDPSLPIVIFSTTLQLPLMQKLRKYGNIFTGLNKNPFTGGESPQEYLSDNLGVIKSYNNLRQKFRGLDIVGEIEQVGPKFSHWEIYIDEASRTETNYFRVAGLMVGYADKNQAQKLHLAMHNTGIRWHETDGVKVWSDGSKTGPLKKVRNENGELAAQWESISSQVDAFTKGFPRYSFCLARELHNAGRPDLDNFHKPRLCNPEGLDNAYFSLLGDLLEAALFDILGAVNQGLSPTVGVFAGSRLRVFDYLEDDAVAPSDADRDRYAAYGVALFNQKTQKRNEYGPIYNPAYQALETSGVLPVVSELLAIRSGHEFSGKLSEGIVSTAAVPMNKAIRRNDNGTAKFIGDNLQSPEYRNLHFIVDIMASLSDPGHESYTTGTLTRFAFGTENKCKGLFDRRANPNEGFLGLQRISRSLDAKEKNVILAAWCFFKMEGNVENILKSGVFAQAVLLRLRNAISKDLTGLQLQQLVLTHADALNIETQFNTKAQQYQNRLEALSSDVRDLEEVIRRTRQAALKAIAGRWRVREFPSSGEYEVFAEKYKKPGYLHRGSRNCAKVRVFADLNELGLRHDAVLPDFCVPDITLLPNGVPCGVLLWPAG